MSISEIGDMTADEITLIAQVTQEKNKEHRQMIAQFVHVGAALIGIAVNEPKKFPRLEDAFPSLFEKKNQQDWRVMKERMESFAQARKVDYV